VRAIVFPIITGIQAAVKEKNGKGKNKYGIFYKETKRYSIRIIAEVCSIALFFPFLKKLLFWKSIFNKLL
jgi:hypothetical protein